MPEVRAHMRSVAVAERMMSRRGAPCLGGIGSLFINHANTNITSGCRNVVSGSST
jgi:hypothetical protein